MNQTLAALATRFWDAYLETVPAYATMLGDHRFDDLLEHVTQEAIDGYLGTLRAIIAEAEALDPGSLERDDALTRELLLSEARNQVATAETNVLIAPLDQFGKHALLQIYAGRATLTEPGQAGAILERYRQVPRLLDEIVTWNQREVAAGRPPVVANVKRVLDQVDGYLASPLDDDPFVACQSPAGWAEADQWRDELRELVADEIRPAYGRFREAVAGFMTSARPDDQGGLTHVTGGDETYRRLITVFTDTAMDPTEIHRIGMEEATARLPEEMTEVGARLFGSTGLTDLLDRLRSDNALRYQTGEEMLDHARGAVTRAWEAAPGWFGLRPENPCDVVEIPAAMAKDLPPAFYTPPAEDGSRPGTYHVNTSAPGDRDRYSTESIAFHEAIPGHHFQVALAQAMDGLPAFRRNALMYAYVEGWGLYAERLADEMALYTSDLDRLGMLTAEAWRAGRLVVDTGLHFHGWSRQQAIDFLTEWTAVAPVTIAQEVDRYIGLPAQALAYKIGQREIMRLRTETNQRLGSRFDVRRFHDVVLGSGPVTLTVLEDLVTSAWA